MDRQPHLGGAGMNRDKETDIAPYGGGGAIPLFQNLTPDFSGDRDLVMGDVLCNSLDVTLAFELGMN